MWYMPHRFHYIIVFVFTLLGLSSCIFPDFKWKEICFNDTSEFSFYLVTRLQTYWIVKKDNVMIIKADTYYYPSSSQENCKHVAFSKVLKSDTEEIENLIIELIRKGEFVPLADKYGCLPEGIHESMGVILHGKEYRWNLEYLWDSVVAEEMEARGVIRIYTQLNERLFYLFPELKNLPTSFPFSQNPPEHVTGKIWSWYERE